MSLHAVTRRLCSRVAGPLLLTVALASAAAGAASDIPPRPVEVFFSVDMERRVRIRQFDPEADTVAVRGNHLALGNWTGRGAPLARQVGTNVYSGWVPFESLSGSPVEYKFVILSGSSPGTVVWERGNNRVFAISGQEPDVRPPGGNGYAEFETEPVVFHHAPGWMPAPVTAGADLSFVPRVEWLGGEFRVGGQRADPLDIFAGHGFSEVRLRLWHTPAEPWHGLDSTLAFALRAKQAGFDLLLDLHFSDTWADPGQQTKPAAWAGLPFDALVDSVYAYTNRVILRFRDAGALPERVQMGNEINPGILWNDGRVGGAWDTPAQWQHLASLLSAAGAAIRDSLPLEERPDLVLHLASGGDNGGCRWFFDQVLAYGVEFDVIGLSYYPWWHGTLADLESNVQDLATRYAKEIRVVETAYPWTLEQYDDTGNFVTDLSQLHPGFAATPEDQLAFLTAVRTILEEAPGGLAAALCLWEPAYLSLPGGENPWENQIVFDFDGDALPALGLVTGWGAVEDGGRLRSGQLCPAPRPNPFQDWTTVEYAVPEGGADVSVAVFDVQGRLVRPLVDARHDAGLYRVTWTGTDGAGLAVAPGLYFCRVTVGSRAGAFKVLRLP